MSYDLLRAFRPGIGRLLTRLFQDATLKVDVTYRLYQGMVEDEDSGLMVASWQEFEIPALPTELRLSSSSVQAGGSIEGGSSGFMFRPGDLPSGTTVEDLTENDEITTDNRTFLVRSINRSLPYVVAVSVDGQ